MLEEIADFSVVKVVDNNCYCVRNKQSNKLYVWEAIHGLNAQTTRLKEALTEELQAFINVDHPNVVPCVKWIEHKPSSILYVVKDHFDDTIEAMLTKCKATRTYLDENFIWQIIYQLCSALHNIISRFPTMSFIKFNISASGIYLDGEKRIKLNYRIVFPQGKNNNLFDDNQQISASIGNLLYQLSTLRKSHSKKQFKIPPQYSNNLYNFLMSILNSYPNVETILHHPILVSQIAARNLEQFKTLASPDKLSVKNECARCIELEKKIAKLQSKKIGLKNKELEVKQREIDVARREKQLASLERLKKQRFNRNRTGYQSHWKRAEDLDSTLSADDSLPLPKTISKMDPTRILKPNFQLQNRRSVHFDTILEKPEPLSDLNRAIWHNFKRMQLNTSKGKENFVTKIRGVPSGASDCGIQESVHYTTQENGLIETFL